MSGGGVVVITEIVNKFATLGHNVTVLTPDVEWTGSRFEPLIDNKVEVIKVETPSRTNLKIAARRCKRNLVKMAMKVGMMKNYDFIFTIFHPFHLAPRAAVEASKKLRIPVLIKIDDAIYEKSTGLKSIQRKIERWYNSRTLQNAQKIMVANEQTKNQIHTYYNVSSDKISIIPNGVNLSNYYKNKIESKNVIFSGVMYSHRGLDILLEATPKIIEEVPDAKMIILGSGPELDKLKKFVMEKNISSSVQFTGWIDRKEIPRYLADACIGIGPLKSTDVTKGALPIKVLEYMASSLPIIAAYDTLSSDVLVNEKNGFFVKNSGELSEKIIFLLKNSNIREQMGKSSKEMVLKFDWKHIVNQILTEYYSIKQI